MTRFALSLKEPGFSLFIFLVSLFLIFSNWKINSVSANIITGRNVFMPTHSEKQLQLISSQYSDGNIGGAYKLLSSLCNKSIVDQSKLENEFRIHVKRAGVDKIVEYLNSIKGFRTEKYDQLIGSISNDEYFLVAILRCDKLFANSDIWQIGIHYDENEKIIDIEMFGIALDSDFSKRDIDLRAGYLINDNQLEKAIASIVRKYNYNWKELEEKIIDGGFRIVRCNSNGGGELCYDVRDYTERLWSSIIPAPGVPDLVNTVVRVGMGGKITAVGSIETNSFNGGK